MVRYARAKGSKASNEKLPEEATSWEEMKRQMIKAQQKKVQPVENLRAILEEDSGNVETTWANFEEPRKQAKIVTQPETNVFLSHRKKKQKIQQKCSAEQRTISDTIHDESKREIDKNNVPKLKKKQKSAKNKSKLDLQAADDDQPKPKKQKFAKNKTNPDFQGADDDRLKQKKQTFSETQPDRDIQGVGGDRPKLKKEKLARNQTGAEVPETDDGQRKHKKQKFANKKTYTDFQETEDPSVHVFQNKYPQNSKFEKGNWKTGNFKGHGSMTRFQKQEAGYPVTRRKQNYDNVSFTIKVGQRELELRCFDGFPVKLEDWKRLSEIQKKLKEKNVPREQIKATMKLERRRAEKALARERKKVCFHCREPGHMLSECPMIGENPFGKEKDHTPDATNTGLCFKCGSLEHSSLHCKVVKEDAYRFAKCFVCQEQGHISRQCPDNPRGLYPRGGGCSECGEVTHFRRDCPKTKKEKEDTSVTVSTIQRDDGLEALDGDSNLAQKTSNKPKEKVVQF